MSRSAIPCSGGLSHFANSSLMLLLLCASATGSDLYLVTLTYDGDPPPGQNVNHFDFSSENVIDVFQQGAPEVFDKIDVRTLGENQPHARRWLMSFGTSRRKLSQMIC